MYRSGLCFFLSVIFRLINVADKVSISSSLTLYPSARWSVSWFPRLAESSYDDTLLKAEVLWLEIRRMPVTSFFWFLIKAGNDCRSEWHKKCAGRIGLPFMTEWLPTHFFLFISIYFFFFLAFSVIFSLSKRISPTCLGEAILNGLPASSYISSSSCCMRWV